MLLVLQAVLINSIGHFDHVFPMNEKDVNETKQQFLPIVIDYKIIRNE